MNIKALVFALPLSALLAGCSASTTMHASDPDVSLHLNKDAPLVLNSAVTRTYSTTSFGQYRFKMVRPGKEPVYGLVPLKFNGGYLAADLLFFCPAMFYNLREVYPFYEFDAEHGVVRYRKRETDGWMTYTPSTAEIARAKAYFEQ